MHSDNFSYMDNLLPLAFKRLGYNVKIISSTIYNNQNDINYKNPGSYYTTEGILVQRLPFVAKGLEIPINLRLLKGFYKAIADFSPDYIYHFNITNLSIWYTIRYKKNHPSVILFYDSHAAFYNSGTNSLSRFRYVMLAPLVKQASLVAEKVFYIGYGERNFLEHYYPKIIGKMDLFPLADFVLDETDYSKYRNDKRLELQIKQDELLVVHSGKLTKDKKTEEIVYAFLESSQEKMKLVIIGSMDSEVEAIVSPLIEKNKQKITFLDWKNAQELQQYLCAADIYVQFSVSSTFQTALCRKCYGITSNYDNTYGYFPEGICKFISDRETLKNELIRIGSDFGLINDLRTNSFKWASKNLNYYELIGSKILKYDYTANLDYESATSESDC